MRWTGLGVAVLATTAAVATAGVRTGTDEPETQGGARHRRVIRVGGGYLGVSLDDLASPDERGAVVRHVVADGPAAKAGLEVDDVVVSFEGEAVRSAAHLSRLVRETPAGRKVALALLRGGVRQQVQLTLEPRRMARMMDGLGDLRTFGLDKLKIEGLDKLRDSIEDLDLPEPPEPPELLEAPEPPEAPQPPLPPFAHEGHRGWSDLFAFGARPRMGIQVVDLTDQLARYFKVDDGVLVSSVSAGSAAEKAGLRAGDIIVKVDGEAVGSSRDLVRRVARGEAARRVDLTVQRDGRPVDVRVQLEPRRTPRGPTT